MRLVPLFDRILVLPVPEGSVTRGGLLIPNIAQQSKVFAYGDVVAVGDGRVNLEGKTAPLRLKVGQTVMFPRKAGVLVPVPDDNGDDVAHLLMREPDVFAIVEGLARDTGIMGADGRLLKMIPTSRGLPDVVYQNRDELEVAEREGFAEPGDFPPDEFEPGDGPVNLGQR